MRRAYSTSTGTFPRRPLEARHRLDQKVQLGLYGLKQTLPRQ